LTHRQRLLRLLPFVADSITLSLVSSSFRSIQGCVITTFLFPDDANFDFNTFYLKLQSRGLVIYPGKLTDADCFRIGSIGRLFERDMVTMVSAVRDILGREMNVSLPVKQIEIATEDSKAA